MNQNIVANLDASNKSIKVELINVPTTAPIIPTINPNSNPVIFLKKGVDLMNNFPILANIKIKAASPNIPVSPSILKKSLSVAKLIEE